MFALALRDCTVVNIIYYYGHEPYKEGLYQIQYLVYLIATT